MVRSRFEIIRDVLKFLSDSDGVLTCKICLKANLDRVCVVRYISFLLSKRFIRFEERKIASVKHCSRHRPLYKFYFITDEGLIELDRLNKFLN